jgi:hypothetical protein
MDFELFCDRAAHGRLAIVEQMLESGELLCNGNAHRALVRAAAQGHVGVVDCLLRQTRALFDPSADDNRAVRLAAYFGHLAVVERLLRDLRVDPSARDNDAIASAAREGHLAVVKRLLQDKRVDPSANENRAIRCASEGGHLAVVDRLLEDDRVDASVALEHSRSEDRKRFECRERLTEICVALQDLELPAWVTIKILYAARPWSTLPLHSKWNLVCTIKHFRDKKQ